MERILLRGRTWSVLIAAALCPLSWPAVLPAQSDIENTSVVPIGKAAQGDGHAVVAELIKPGDSGRRQRLEASSQLPLEKLSSAAQQQVQHILKDLSLYRRLPTLEIDADRRAYEFFTSHPDVAVSIWRAMEISNVQMWQTGPNSYDMDTRDGTTGTVEVLLRSPENCLILCDGHLQSPGISRPIRARALLHLQSRFGDNGKVVHSVDLFVSFPSQTVETIARLISPLSNRIADRNFEEVSLFIEMMSGAMARQPGWVEQVSAKMDGVLASRPQELMQLTAAVYVDAERQRLTALGIPVSAESIKPPVLGQTAAGTTDAASAPR